MLVGHLATSTLLLKFSLEAEGCVYRCTLPETQTRPTFCVMLSETGSDHLHVIAEEVSRVAELCIGQDMATMSTA